MAYDIGEALDRIEEELIASMIRNMGRHRIEEIKEEKEWTMWQAEQLKSLRAYRQDNKDKYSGRFLAINEKIEEAIRKSYAAGGMHEERKILRAAKKGAKLRQSMNPLTGRFFQLNKEKLEALIKATKADMTKAETAILRMADDQYRKAIFNAQVYANSGAGTYEQAVDMATKSMLSSGLNCVEYKNGARHTLPNYARMAVRTANKRAYLSGEGEKRRKWGITTVILAKRGNPCPKCAPFVGKVFIDDVWSGGGKNDGNYPLLSSAIGAGLYHPNCKDSHTTYFPELHAGEEKWTKEELEEVAEDYNREQKEKRIEHQVTKFERLSKFSLDPENKKQYDLRARLLKKHVFFKTGNMSLEEYADYKRYVASFNAASPERVVELLRKDAEAWIEGLSEAQKQSIRKYSFNLGDKKPNRFFERLNTLLRNGEINKNPRMKEHADRISESIEKFKLSHNVIAYRESDFDFSMGAKVGEFFTPKQFISTSVRRNGTLTGGYAYKLYVSKGRKAAYIEFLSHFPNQRELLIDKDAIFKVLSRQGNLIELEVIT